MSNSERVKQEVLNKLKGLSETVADSIGQIAKGKNVFVESTVQSSRMAICHSCPDFNATTTQCKRCGCFMSAKTRLKVASCPIAKWGADT
jgi:hypothetical protein